MQRFLKITFVIALVIIFTGEAFPQNVPDEAYEVLVGKSVTVKKTDGMSVTGVFEKDKPDRVIIINEDGDIISIMKKDIRQIKAAGKPSKSSSKYSEEDEEETPKKYQKQKKLSPEDQERKDELLAMYNSNMRSYNSQRRAGNALFIPGIILTGLGAGCMILGYSGVFDIKRSDYHYSYYESYYTYETDHSVSDGFIYAGWIGAGVGITCMTIGIVLKATAAPKKKKAEQYLRQANEISWDINPIINPYMKHYGLNFTLRY